MNKLQQAWDVIAEYIVQNSSIPNDPMICLFIQRQVNYHAETYKVVMVTGGENSETIIASKPYKWEVRPPTNTNRR